MRPNIGRQAPPGAVFERIRPPGVLDCSDFLVVTHGYIAAAGRTCHRPLVQTNDFPTLSKVKQGGGQGI
nr:hypothetical protein KPHV_24920 [Kitasatospora purpeofusca]